jgi:trans-2,3-dihydro-3-hydroxyanthranilate isomerase
MRQWWQRTPTHHSTGPARKAAQAGEFRRSAQQLVALESQVMLLPFYHIDVFTRVPYQGNPASVLVGTAAFEEQQMQAIAREIGLPGNGFVWPVPGEPDTFHIRFFTPQQEVSLSGHTSLACAHALVCAAPAGVSRSTLTFWTRSARLIVEQQEAYLWLTLPLPRLQDYPGSPHDVVAGLNLSVTDLRPGFPLQLSPENDLLIPLAEGIELAQVMPDVRALAALGQGAGIRGFCLFTTRTRDPASHVHSRFFAPHYGVPEDPATGSVHGPLALYLWQYGLIQPQGNVVSLVGEQGEVINRPSRVRVEVALRGNMPHQVRVGGETVTVIQGHINMAL